MEEDTPSTSSAETPPKCDCILERLLGPEPFALMSYERRNEVIKRGRPTPPLPNLNTRTKNYVRHFQKSWYTTFTWLCGCTLTQKLYCWPCVLFSNDAMWTKLGVTDINNFINLKNRHENSIGHIISLIALIKFDKNRIDLCLSNALTSNVEKHNEQVKKNRHIVRCLIEATCFLALQELPFGAGGETGDSKGNYIELLHLLAKKDGTLSNHLKSSSVFQGSSKDTQNELIDSIAKVLTVEISKEVQETVFVAAMMDETVDVSNRHQLSTVLRYVSKNGGVRERFLRCADVTDDRTAAVLAGHLFNCLSEFNCEEKLVAQTYEGAEVVAGLRNGLKKLFQHKFPLALFTHCYAHEFNSLLKQSVDHIRECKVFFQTVSAIGSFFSKSFKRTIAVNKIIQKHYSSVPQTGWLCNSRLIELVSSIKVELEEFFSVMKDDIDEWDGETRASARGFYSILREFDFNFLLNVFSKILPNGVALFQILQTKLFNIRYCLQEIDNFQIELDSMRDMFEGIWLQTEAQEGETVVPIKRKRESIDLEDRKLFYRCLFFEILDTVTNQMANRYSEFQQLEFLSLLCCENFNRYAIDFPDLALTLLKECFGGTFDFPHLRTELTVMYSLEEFKNKNFFELMEYLSSSGLDAALPEVKKLGNLILTIPVMSASKENTFSAPTRIKVYLQSMPINSQLSGLALLSIEKQLLRSAMQQVTFYDSVIEIFDQRKTCRIDLHYK